MSIADAIDHRDEIGLHLRMTALGGSPLSRALQRGEDHGWLPVRPRSLEAWREHARRIRESFGGRDWLSPLDQAFEARGPAAARLRDAAAHGLVVTTGQQPGLFGGPLYTLSKAIGAIAFADALQNALQIPVAPVFWAATDDADWREAAVARFAGPRGLVVTSLPGPATDGIAMAEVPLGAMDACWVALDAACGSGADLRVRRLLEASYAPGATVGGAYLTLLRELLEPHGMAVLDAAHPAVRSAADPITRLSLRHAGAVDQALLARSRAIEAAGHRPQVELLAQLSLVFRITREPSEPATRIRIPIAEAERHAEHAPVGSLGPNVLLRPIVERALLPTVSYLAGPGELAYFAQVTAVADALALPQPMVAPRFACEMIEERQLTRLRALGLSEEELTVPGHAEGMIARALMGEQSSDALERLRVTLEAQLRAIGESVEGDAVVPVEVVDGLARDLAHRVDRFERRLVAGIKRREQRAMEEVAVLRAAWRPLGQAPERMLNPMPLLVRHGLSVIDRMRACAQPYAQALVQPSSTES